MKQNQIAHGNTYCGRTGLPRRVTLISLLPFSGQIRVAYITQDGKQGYCYRHSFAAWATGFSDAVVEAASLKQEPR